MKIKYKPKRLKFRTQIYEDEDEDEKSIDIPPK